MPSFNYLVTGSAGFIGYHVADRLLALGATVVGFDNLNDYYSRELKLARNARLLAKPGYTFVQDDLANQAGVEAVFARHEFRSVIHLAAQAGVRYSLENPRTYLKSNIDGTLNILEAARFAKSKPHLLIASSSSVYGLSKNYPYREEDSADRPAALYGATKRADELMAHSYSHLFGLKTTLLRFFTVYGPWGRPDMALFMFVENILKGKPIEVFNNGDMVRDFTYVSDIVDGILGLDDARVDPKRAGQEAYEIFNIGCAHPRQLMEFVRAIETALGRRAVIEFKPFQAGDVHKTSADVSKLSRLTGYQPKVKVEDGIQAFVKWYREHYKVD